LTNIAPFSGESLGIPLGDMIVKAIAVSGSSRRTHNVVSISGDRNIVESASQKVHSRIILTPTSVNVIPIVAANGFGNPTCSIARIGCRIILLRCNTRAASSGLMNTATADVGRYTKRSLRSVWVAMLAAVRIVQTDVRMVFTQALYVIGPAGVATS
jgi:hypothetical protein